MAVAKSYENMEICGEPYSYNNDPKKFYVKVKGPCHRCGGSGHYSYNSLDGTICYGCRGSGKEIKEVRWYTESQRAALDRAAEKRSIVQKQKQEERRIKFSARNAFGFGELGFITILWGDNEKIKEWRSDLPKYTVMYNTIFGWYMPSDKTVEIPKEFNYLRINWEDVRDTTDSENLLMKDNAVVHQYVHELIYGVSKSEYQGKKDEWLEKDVTITKNISLSSNFGDSHMHIMEDKEGNVYVWTTASKNLEENTSIHMRMKVKEHKEYEGVKQTVVYYCKIK